MADDIRPRTERECMVPGCDRSVLAREMCSKHYGRWLRLGDPGPAGDLPRKARPTKPTPPCKRDGCPDPARARGWCKTHSYRVARYGTPGVATVKRHKPRGGPCEIPRCPRLAVRGGMCTPHRVRQEKYGDPLAGPPIRGIRGEGTTSRDGYRVITVNGKQVLEHRHVMEQHLGRSLTANETVHHRFGDRSRNTVDQLELWYKAQPSGQRVSDLIAYIAEYHADAVKAEIRRQDLERRTGQLRLADMPSAHVSEAS